MNPNVYSMKDEYCMATETDAGSTDTYMKPRTTLGEAVGRWKSAIRAIKEEVIQASEDRFQRKRYYDN